MFRACECAYSETDRGLVEITVDSTWQANALKASFLNRAPSSIPDATLIAVCDAIDAIPPGLAFEHLWLYKKKTLVAHFGIDQPTGYKTLWFSIDLDKFVRFQAGCFGKFVYGVHDWVASVGTRLTPRVSPLDRERRGW
jgi:hypothetical protein